MSYPIRHGFKFGLLAGVLTVILSLAGSIVFSKEVDVGEEVARFVAFASVFGVLTWRAARHG